MEEDYCHFSPQKYPDFKGLCPYRQKYLALRPKIKYEGKDNNALGLIMRLIKRLIPLNIKANKINNHFYAY